MASSLCKGHRFARALTLYIEFSLSLKPLQSSSALACSRAARANSARQEELRKQKRLQTTFDTRTRRRSCCEDMKRKEHEAKQSVLDLAFIAEELTDEEKVEQDGDEDEHAEKEKDSWREIGAAIHGVISAVAAEAAEAAVAQAVAQVVAQAAKHAAAAAASAANIAAVAATAATGAAMEATAASLAAPMRCYCNQIAAIQGQACELARQLWHAGNGHADDALREIVAQPTLAAGLVDISTTLDQQLHERVSMQEMARAVRVAERRNALHLAPMQLPAPIAARVVEAAKGAMVDEKLPAAFEQNPGDGGRAASLAAFASIHGDAGSRGAHRLRELLEHESAVDAASQSPRTTVEEMEQQLRAARAVRLPEASPALLRGNAVAELMIRRRAVSARIITLLKLIDEKQIAAAPALAPAVAADAAGAALEQALAGLREGLGGDEQDALVGARDDARRALIVAMEVMQRCDAEVAGGGLGAAHAVLQVALEDLRAELEDAVPCLESETRALFHSAESGGAGNEDEDESKAPQAATVPFDALVQQCAAAHGRADAHAALLAQLADAAGTLERCDNELPRLQEYEAAPPDPKALVKAGRALKWAKTLLRQAREKYEHEAGDDDIDEAELQELLEGVDKAKEERLAAESALNALRDVALKSVEHFIEISAVLAEDIPQELLRLWQPHRHLSDFVASEEITGGRHPIHKVSHSDGGYSVVKEYRCVGEARKYFFRELQRLHALQHPCIMEIEAIFVDSERKTCCVQMPFCHGGNLDAFIKAQLSAETMNGSNVRLLLRRALQGVGHLHALGIVHADLKPANILVDGNGIPRLTDFETSRAADADARSFSLTNAGGTLGFIAPELVTGSALPTKASDMFAFGKTLEKAYDAANTCMDRVGRVGLDALTGLITELVVEDPDARLTALQALQHRYFTTDAAEEEARLLSAAESRAEEAQSKREKLNAQLQEVYGEQRELRSQAAELARRHAETEKGQREVRAAAERYEQQVRAVQSDQRMLQAQREMVDAAGCKAREKLAAEERLLQEKRHALAQRHEALKRQGETLPSYWSMRSLKSSLRRVDVTAQKTAEIQRLLDGTCNSATLNSGRNIEDEEDPYSRLVVAKITRIESPVIWRMYAAKREAMRAALFKSNAVSSLAIKTDAPWMRTELDTAVNEKYVWHGTKPEHIDTIAQHGFDERVGSLDGRFGAGIYFADMCSKSDQYCTPDGCRSFYLFLSRAMFGACHETGVAMQQTRRPPDMPIIPGRPHDSIVYVPGGNRYSEFIVYDAAQAYPEYLVEYKRVWDV